MEQPVKTKDPAVEALTKQKPKDPTWVWTNGICCQTCKSTRLAHVLSVADDRHYVIIGKEQHCDYLPEDLGIGGGPDNEITYCLDCGQIQGKWPLPRTKIEQNGLEKTKTTKPITGDRSS